MKSNATTRVDPQGRVMIPAHIRKAMDLMPGDELGIDVDQFGTIHLETTKERCCLCGESADNSVTIGHRQRRICRNCSEAIRKAVE